MVLRECLKFYFEGAAEQCPPAVSTPEPAAIKGGSKRKSIGLEAIQSQLKKPIRMIQKTGCKKLYEFFILEPVMSTNTNTESGAQKRHQNPKPAMKTSR